MKKILIVIIFLLVISGCYATLRKNMPNVWCNNVMWEQNNKTSPPSQFAVCETEDGEKVQVVIVKQKETK